MIRVVARNFDIDTLPVEKYQHLIELNKDIYPFEGFESRKWNESEFDRVLEESIKDDFMPCNYLFFFEGELLIGIIKGNFADDECTIIELIQASEVGKGYGSKIINTLPSIGIDFITGYSTMEALDWWTKMNVDFSGNFMFNKYPLFTKALQ